VCSKQPGEEVEHAGNEGQRYAEIKLLKKLKLKVVKFLGQSLFLARVGAEFHCWLFDMLFF
jgi:hypothetical protein